jgi:small-conductance mechanosensitive channel
MFWENKYVSHLLIPLIILVVAFISTKILRILLTKYFNKTSKFLKVDQTRFNFVKNAVSFIIFLGAFVVIFYSIPELKALGVTLFAGAGIFAAFLGFASQQAFSNIVSGIFLVIFKPFRVSDHIKIGELNVGIVEDINLRHTVIRNYENRRIVIPNSTISSEIIINSTITDEKICSFMEMGISYDSDMNKAIELIKDEVSNHPNYIDVRTKQDIKDGKPLVRVRVIGWGDSSVNLRAYIWAQDSETAFVTRSDLYKSIKERFDAEGIEIPFPYRTLVFKNKPE